MGAFGDYELRTGPRELRRDGEVVHLEPQAFDLLVHLVRHRDRVVPKEELLDAVWGTRFVSEYALTTQIKELRRATGDDGRRQEVIANVRGRGYRFVAPYRTDPDDAGHDDHPAPPSSLLGRSADLAQVEELIAGGRLVTMVGPGGVGKTVLARTLASLLADRPADGVHVVELAGLRRGTDLLATIAREMGVATSGADRRAILSAVTHLDALVVLDDCDHVVDEAAATVNDLLGGSSRLAILATSRERLGCRTERVWPLLPLSVDAARALLIDRAGAAGAAAIVEARTDAELDALTAALDHLPLALEMAAARLASGAFDDLLALASTAPSSLRSPDRSAPTRHRTLAAVVDSSIELLDPVEVRVLGAVAAFSGPVRSIDVTALTVEPETGGPVPRAVVDDALGRLVERSLVVAGTATAPATYSVLATVRDGTRHRLGPTPEARRAAHLLEVAREADRSLRTSDEAEGHETLTLLLADVRASATWAVAHDPALARRLLEHLHTWSYSRLWGEPAAWARELTGADLRGAPLGLRALLAGDAAHRGATSLVDVLIGDPGHLGRGLADRSALEVLADACFYTGELERARHLGDALLQRADAETDPHARASALASITLAGTYRGTSEPATDALRELVLLEDQLGPTGRAWSRYVRAECLTADDPDGAATLLDEALALASSVSSRYVGTVAGIARAALLGRGDDPRHALPHYEAVLSELRRHGNLAHAITAMRNLAELLVRLDDPAGAMVLLAAADDGAVRPSYGAERARLDRQIEAISKGCSATDVDRWQAEGARLGAHGALARAEAIVRGHEAAPAS